MFPLGNFCHNCLLLNCAFLLLSGLPKKKRNPTTVQTPIPTPHQARVQVHLRHPPLPAPLHHPVPQVVQTPIMTKRRRRKRRKIVEKRNLKKVNKNCISSSYTVR